MRMIFVNLPVKNVEASKKFFAALGFSHNPQFSDERTASIVISDAIVVMLLEESRFKEFIPSAISDATKAKEVLLGFSCDSRKEVEELTAKAFAAGATPFMPPQDHGFMYGKTSTVTSGSQCGWIPRRQRRTEVNLRKDPHPASAPLGHPLRTE